MKKHFVISNIPIKLPIQSTILYTFLLYYFKVPGLVWGIFITLYLIYWIIIIIAIWNQIKIDLNSDELDKNKEMKSKFAQRLQNLIDK